MSVVEERPGVDASGRDAAFASPAAGDELTIVEPRATAYLTAVGPAGLREVVELGMTRARQAAAALREAGLGERRFSAPYLAEVAVRVPDARRRHAALAERGIVAGAPLGRDYPALDDTLLLAATELTTDADVERLVAALGETR